MSDQSEELKRRAKAFAVSVLRLIDRFPRLPGAQVVAKQLAESSTSMGANYRAACTARSRAEFIAKLCIVNEESDESVYWLEVIDAVPYRPPDDVQPLLAEAIELRSIFARSLGTARGNR